ncbi:MAG: hypothetical protein ATN34_03270 [Epulopiscium sp. Nele67-Bin002]|nr:MAG: hypothetical protein BEN18_00325 [Epulopiscium sp. Nuni2H_MBin001]OON91530.1 MAG: hypothetical protein ATN34_03270 [Epulopiscium sp. Nele67-Bin002]
MRIGSVDQVNQIYNTPVTSAYKQPELKAGLVDEAQFSDEALVRGAAYKAVQDTPEARMDRVNELKAQIDSGTYDVSARDVSEAIFNQMFI